MYIDPDIWLKSNISGNTIERNSPLEGCVIVLTVPRGLTDLKVKSVVVLIREIWGLALV